MSHRDEERMKIFSVPGKIPGIFPGKEEAFQGRYLLGVWTAESRENSGENVAFSKCHCSAQGGWFVLSFRRLNRAFPACRFETRNFFLGAICANSYKRGTSCLQV